MSRPSAQQVRELAQFYATEGDAYGHLAEDLAREAARFEVEEAAFEERVQSLAPVVWGELTKHDPNTWPEMSVHSLEGAKDVARVVLVWLDAQEPADVEPEVWESWWDVPKNVRYLGTEQVKRPSLPAFVNRNGRRYLCLSSGEEIQSDDSDTEMVRLAPFVMDQR